MFLKSSKTFNVWEKDVRKIKKINKVDFTETQRFFLLKSTAYLIYLSEASNPFMTEADIYMISASVMKELKWKWNKSNRTFFHLRENRSFSTTYSRRFEKPCIFKSSCSQAFKRVVLVWEKLENFPRNICCRFRVYKWATSDNFQLYARWARRQKFFKKFSVVYKTANFQSTTRRLLLLGTTLHWGKRIRCVEIRLMISVKAWSYSKSTMVAVKNTWRHGSKNVWIF